MTQDEINKAASEYGESFKTGEWFETLRMEAFKAGANYVANKLPIHDISSRSLKEALREKIVEFEGYIDHPDYSSRMEQNAVAVTLREFKYLDSIAEVV